MTAAEPRGTGRWGLAVFALAFAGTWLAIRTPFFVRRITDYPAPALLALLAAAALAGAFARTPAGATSPAYRVLARSTIGVLAAYLLLADPATVAGLAGSERLTWVAAGRLLAIACAVGSWWRPALALPVPLAVSWFRQEVGAGLGTYRDAVWDYVPVVHLALALALAPLAARGVAALRRRLGHAPAGDNLATPTRAAVALFFSHYLWSGVAKTRLDGGPIAWVLENRTHLLTVVSRELGILPFAELGEWGSRLPAVLARLDRPLNLVTLTLELGCVLALVRRRWTMAIAVAYVGVHLVIFVVSGVFFWKWIIVDLAIVVAMRRLADEPFPDAVRAALLAIVLVAPMVMPTARLGWFDTRSLHHAYLEAVAADGRVVRVPSNFFLAGSLSVVQQDFGYQPLERVWELSLWGHTGSLGVMAAANRCDAPARRLQLDEGRLDTLERYLRAHHELMLARAGADGRVAYDLYPHHIWSDPTSFREFARLDLRRVTGYRWVAQRVCLAPGDSGEPVRVEERVIHEIPLNDDPPTRREATVDGSGTAPCYHRAV